MSYQQAFPKQDRMIRAVNAASMRVDCDVNPMGTIDSYFGHLPWGELGDSILDILDLPNSVMSGTNWAIIRNSLLDPAFSLLETLVKLHNFVAGDHRELMYHVDDIEAWLIANGDLNETAFYAGTLFGDVQLSIVNTFFLFYRLKGINISIPNPFAAGQRFAFAGGEVAADSVIIISGETIAGALSPIAALLELDHFVFDLDKMVNGNGVTNRNSGIPVKDRTTASNGLEYKSNPKHTPGQPGNRPNAGIEPKNSLELFEQSVASEQTPNQRFAYDKNTNTLHRFFNSGDGTWHWSGSTNQGSNSITGNQVPNDIKTLFGLPKKGW